MLVYPASHGIAYVVTFYFYAGAQPRFQSWGVQFLGLGYYTEQNTDGIPSSCTAVCSYVKNWGGRSKFWGSGPPTPEWLRPCFYGKHTHENSHINSKKDALLLLSVDVVLLL